MGRKNGNTNLIAIHRGLQTTNSLQNQGAKGTNQGTQSRQKKNKTRSEGMHPIKIGDCQENGKNPKVSNWTKTGVKKTDAGGDARVGHLLTEKKQSRLKGNWLKGKGEHGGVKIECVGPKKARTKLLHFGKNAPQGGD